MKISGDFPGGNIKILGQQIDSVSVEVDLRDTEGDWFYWCFKVEGAAGKTVTFTFNDVRVGYYGAAISHDFKNWAWQYEDKAHQGSSFTYSFGQTEDEVYFAHDMLYRPERFEAFARDNGFEIKTLCETQKGRAVPYIEFGTGEQTILLTARHHACESTGSYVLEGILGELIKEKHFQNYHIICVPFVDFDGVTDGDQGKNRRPYDHNRDYSLEVPAIHETTAVIRSLAESYDIKYAFDFHSPWQMYGENDTVFIPVKRYELVDEIARFSKIWQSKNCENALPHFEKDNMQPNVRWNKVGEIISFAPFFYNAGAKLTFTVETPYFCASNIAFSVSRAIGLGKNFVKALKEYDSI